MRRLKLLVSPLVSVGNDLVATVSAEGVDTALVYLEYPDNLRVSGQDKTEIELSGAPVTLSWKIISLSHARSAMIEVKVLSGNLYQAGIAKVFSACD